MAQASAVSKGAKATGARRAGTEKRGGAVNVSAVGINGEGKHTPFDNVSFAPAREADIARAMSSRCAPPVRRLFQLFLCGA